MNSSRIILCMTLAILSFSCKKEETKAPSKTIICGQVVGMAEPEVHSTIQISIPDLVTGQVVLNSDLDSEGRFRFEVDIDTPTDFYIIYSSRLSYFMNPGDSLFFRVDGRCWDILTHTDAEEYAFYSASGTSAEMNRLGAEFTATFNDSVYDMRNLYAMLYQMPPDSFALAFPRISSQWDAFVRTFLSEVNGDDQFNTWAMDKIKYTKWNTRISNLMYYPMMKRMDLNAYLTSLPEGPMKYLPAWDKNDRSALQHSEFHQFLYNYGMLIEQSMPTDSLNDMMDLGKEDGGKSLIRRTSYISNQEKGWVKDAIVASYLYMMLDKHYFYEIQDELDPAWIEDPGMREQIEEKIAKEKELFERIANTQYNSLADDNEVLRQLAELYPDKVLYIDFWAPWCSPCIGEMPFSAARKKDLSGKDVVFVYLASQCTENQWKVSILENDIRGEHFLLNDVQFQSLAELLGIQGIPHYTLLDKEGHIVEKSAPRPSSGDELLYLIENNL